MALKRALLGPRWSRENHRKCFRKNGGDDETRTRDLCRDSALWTPSNNYWTMNGPRNGLKVGGWSSSGA